MRNSVAAAILVIVPPWKRDRELRACGRRGHVLYAPVEESFARRLSIATPAGEAWRCLRCGDFVIAAPTMSGPARDAPVPARGKALRQEIILRVLAVERIIRGLVLLAAGYGIQRFATAQAALRAGFTDTLPIIRSAASRLGLDIDRSWVIREATHALHAPKSTLTLAALLVAAYGILELVEGVGLWLQRRWAEYLTVVATAAFLPIEVRDLVQGLTATRAGAFALNLAVLAYLVVAKRLFGARGGQRRSEELRASQSLLEVESAAFGQPTASS